VFRLLPIVFCLLLTGCNLCWLRGQAMGPCPDDDDDVSDDDDSSADDDDIGPDDDDVGPDDDDSGPDDDDVGPDDDDSAPVDPCVPGALLGGPVVEAAGYDLICVEPDTFQMGSEVGSPDHAEDELWHTVTLTRWFAAGRTELTQDLYEAVIGENPSDCDHGCGDDHPVHNVDWVEAVTFCNALSKLEGLEPAYTLMGEETQVDLDATGYRLPTEAEWEYVARAGEDHLFSGGDDVDEVGFCVPPPIFDDFVWPVGLRQPNAWGFVDMSGNAEEWVYDRYDDEYYADGQEDPTGPFSGSFRGSRGGTYYSFPAFCRVANRSYDFPGSTSEAQGFRIVRTLPLSR